MPSTHRRTDDAELRAVVAGLLQSRRDVSPSELVELLGGHVLWGPSDPPAVAVGAARDPAFAA
jgi:hypothetical protein